MGPNMSLAFQGWRPFHDVSMTMAAAANGSLHCEISTEIVHIERCKHHRDWA